MDYNRDVFWEFVLKRERQFVESEEPKWIYIHESQSPVKCILGKMFYFSLAFTISHFANSWNLDQTHHVC